MEFLTNCLFVGKEAEGYDIGSPTLFVGKYDVTIEELVCTLEKYPVKAIYFGAGNNRGISPHLIPLVKLLYPMYKIRLEIDKISDLDGIPDDLINKIEVILVIPIDKSGAEKIKAIKFLSPTYLSITYPKSHYITYLDDPLFSEDTVVVQ